MKQRDRLNVNLEKEVAGGKHEKKNMKVDLPVKFSRWMLNNTF